MKHRAKHSVSMIALGLSLVATTAQAGFGEHRYGCQVITINEQQGYISARADTLEEAKGMASRAEKVPTRALTQEPVKEVVQCVELPNGKFSDSDFQKWVDEELPR